MDMPHLIAYFTGLILTWIGIVILVRPFFRWYNGKEKVYRISIPGWIVAGIGTLILGIGTSKYSTFSVWLISFVGIVIVKNKQKKESTNNEEQPE